jgi:hypothetical protein
MPTELVMGEGGELTEQLRVRPSRERKRARDDHMILCSTFEFLFEFQVVLTSTRSKLEGPLYMYFIRIYGGITQNYMNCLK